MTEEETIAQWLVVAARDRDPHTLLMIVDFMEAKGLWSSPIRIEVHFLRAFLRRLADVGRPDTSETDWHVIGAAVARLKLAMIPSGSGDMRPELTPTVDESLPY